MPGTLRKLQRVSRTALLGVRKTRLAFYYREKLRKEEKRLERLFFCVKIYRTFDCFLIEKW